MGVLNLITPDDVRAFSRHPAVCNADDEVLESKIDEAEALMVAEAPEGYKRDPRSRSLLVLAAKMIAERLVIGAEPRVLTASVLGLRREKRGSYEYERYPAAKLSETVITPDIAKILDACRIDQGGILSVVVQPIYTESILAEQMFARREE